MDTTIDVGLIEGATHEDGLGGKITILERGDAVRPMRFRMVLPPGFGPPSAECHPAQQEDFHVLRGTLGLGKVDGTQVVLRQGDRFSLPAGSFHLPRNAGDGDLEFEAILTPGLDSATMFEKLYAATRENTGVKRLARTALVFHEHRRAITFPLPVRVAMAVVAWVARTLGP